MDYILKTKIQNSSTIVVNQIYMRSHSDVTDRVKWVLNLFRRFSNIVHSIFYFDISDYETDEETPSPAKKRGRNAAKVKNEPVSQDDSLMLDAGDDILPSTGKR